MGELAREVLIYGAGGHGKVVLDALERSGRAVAGFVDDAAERASGEYCGYRVYPGAELPDVVGDREVVVAIGDASRRASLTARLDSWGVAAATVIHPTAVLARDVQVSAGAMILAGAVINPGVRIGRGAIVNTSAVIDHDCDVGAFAHVAPAATLAGHVRVGDRALVGAAATVIPEVTIGADATVGAGAAVVCDVDAGTTVAGVPARKLSRRSGPR